MSLALLMITILTLLIHKWLHDLILGYNTFNVDWIHEEEDLAGERLDTILSKLDEKYASRWLILSLVTLLLFLSPYFQTWKIFENYFSGFIVVMVVTLFLTWKYAFTDIDPSSNRTLYPHRILIVLCGIGTFLSPLFLVPFLNLGFNYFKAWLHHNQMPIRILQITISFLLATQFYVLLSHYFLDFPEINKSEITILHFIFLLSIYAMHYWVPAAKKLLMSRHGKIWLLHNELHYIIAGAYTWGWLKFLKQGIVLQVIKNAKNANLFFQVSTILVESSTLLIVFLPRYWPLIFVGILIMHLLIFICSGILFWEYILTGISFICAMNIGSSIELELLSREFQMAFIILTIVMPLIRVPLLRPKALGWWDAPLAGRYHWEVIGESGKKYELYNDQFGPHERTFGRVYGRFLSNHKFIYNHLGEVNRHELKIKLISTQGDLDKIDKLKESYGISYADENFTYLHDAYINNLVLNLNLANSKHLLPPYLRFLKPLGGQFYYWGELPRFRAEEKIVKVEVRFKEYFFDGSNFKLILNKVVRELNF